MSDGLVRDCDRFWGFVTSVTSLFGPSYHCPSILFGSGRELPMLFGGRVKSEGRRVMQGSATRAKTRTSSTPSVTLPPTLRCTKSESERSLGSYTPSRAGKVIKLPE